MKGLLSYVVFVLVLMLSSIHADAISLAGADFFERMYVAAATRVEAHPTGRVGTGFFMSLGENADRITFVTNQHVIENAKTLRFSVPVLDPDKTRADTNPLVMVLPLSADSVVQCYIPDDSLDLAFVTMPREGLEKKQFTSFPDSVLCDTKHLFSGQSVIFVGYPLDLSVERGFPLLRQGMIAGIDAIRDVVYLDADAFGGSSGSPVLIDFGSQVNAEFWKTHTQMLVGMITGYKPYKKQLVNPKTQQTEMIQTENSGIAVIVPAETIREWTDSLFAR